MKFISMPKWFVAHALPVLAFIMLAAGFYGHNYRQQVKDTDGRGDRYTLRNTFLHGRYDQGIYRGIGVTAYTDGKRVGWYPGASIAGGIAWRLMGRPPGRGPLGTYFLLGFYIPSILAGLGFFYCFYRYAFKKWGPKAASWALLSLLTFGPSFYYLTAFPYNIALFCMSAYLLVYESQLKGRMGWLALLGWYCSITYPSAVLFALFPLVSEVIAQTDRKRFQLMPYIYYGAPFALGPFMFYGYLYLVTGDFFAYVHHQSSVYGRNFIGPLDAVLEFLFQYPLTNAENYVTMMVLFYWALFANKRLGAPLWAYMVALIMFSPITGSHQCVYRHYLLAFPLHYLLALSDKHALVKSLVIYISMYFSFRILFRLYLLNGLT